MEGCKQFWCNRLHTSTLSHIIIFHNVCIKISIKLLIMKHTITHFTNPHFGEGWKSLWRHMCITCNMLISSCLDKFILVLITHSWRDVNNFGAIVYTPPLSLKCIFRGVFDIISCYFVLFFTIQYNTNTHQHTVLQTSRSRHQDLQSIHIMHKTIVWLSLV